MICFLLEMVINTRFEVLPEDVYEAKIIARTERCNKVGPFQTALKFTLSTFKKLNVSLLIFSLCCDPLKFFTREKCQSMSNTPWLCRYNSNSSSARISYN